MNNLMPCGLDDSRNWDVAIDTRVSRALDELEEADPRTLLEKRLSWICNEWESALAADTHEEWNGVRLMLYGAIQGITNYPGLDKLEDARAMRELSNMAVENMLDCIKAGRFEGATN